jgi:hypothetical protein
MSKIDELVDAYLTEGGLGKKTIEVVNYMESEWDEMLGADEKQWRDHLKGKFGEKFIETALKYYKVSGV